MESDGRDPTVREKGLTEALSHRIYFRVPHRQQQRRLTSTSTRRRHRGRPPGKDEELGHESLEQEDASRSDFGL